MGTRMLRGRKGASGYVRSGEEGAAMARGLPPGAVCRLYQARPRGYALCGTATADRQGGVRLPCPGEEALFLAVGQEVLLWEEGPDQAQDYLRAQNWLNAQAAPPPAAPQPEEKERPPRPLDPLPPHPGRITEAAAPPPAAPQPEEREHTPRPLEPLPPHPGKITEAAAPHEASVPPETREIARETDELTEFSNSEKPAEEIPPETQLPAHEPPEKAPAEDASLPAREETWLLRPESEAEPADALPTLLWPQEAAALKPYFDQGAPIAPFDAPGWRFVRAPSPLRGIPYCAIGYCARDSRVVQVAYAVPGTPYQAPAALPGYRYQMGREGQGYWTLWRRLDWA